MVWGKWVSMISTKKNKEIRYKTARVVDIMIIFFRTKKRVFDAKSESKNR